ncbi:MAG: hypothetical protein MZV65_42500 [Chromatiales bacterium]|nr:hypothetical protein [Chromatiales bacterium]
MLDLVWPGGIQEELSQPVAVLLNEESGTIALASQAGFRCFTDVEVFRRYVTEEILAENTDWTRILHGGEFLERLRTGFTHLANAGVPAPDAIGVEHEDGDDYRLAEALWESARLVLLTTAQQECAERWIQASYQVIAESDNWWLAVEAALSEQAM